MKDSVLHRATMTTREINTLQRKASHDLLSMFFQLADEWVLTNNEQALLIGEGSLKGLKESIDLYEITVLDHDAIARLVLLDSIGRDIRALFPGQDYPEYVRAPKDHLDAQSPLYVMISDSTSGIEKVCAYIKGIKLGIFPRN